MESNQKQKPPKLQDENVQNNEYEKKKQMEKSLRHSQRTRHSYFPKHDCSVSLNKQQFRFGNLGEAFFYLTSVRCGDVRALRMFRSYAALRAEVNRHALHFPFSVHPFSRWRLFVDFLSIFVLLGCHTVVSVYASHSHQIIFCDSVLMFFELLFVINIITNFFTGYVEGITSERVVLDLKKIVWRYVRTWLLVDILFCVGLFFPRTVKLDSDVGWTDLAELVKVLRTPALFRYTWNVMDVTGVKEVTRTVIEMTLLLYYFVIWNIFFQFHLEYISEGSFMPDVPSNCSWMSINGLWNSTTHERWIFALLRSVNMLRQNSNLNILTSSGGCYAIFIIISWIIAKLIVIHCMIKFLILNFGLEAARAHYYIMMQQVQNYMNQRKFSVRLKNKILKFYAVRFQSVYFLESKLINMVSGQLREDIIMHSGRQLVNQVEFLNKLPRTLLFQIGLRLKLVIFLAGDIIYKINTVAECLYFIDKGTVAVYSASGKEICHLEDGSFFGEHGLIMKLHYRFESVVAVTNLELYTLDKKDFDSTIACYPTVYEDIKRIAAQRHEEVMIIDEHHKTELRMGKGE